MLTRLSLLRLSRLRPTHVSRSKNALDVLSILVDPQVMTTLTEPALSATLADLHRVADTNDERVMPRVLNAAAEREATSDREVADMLADAYMPIDRANGLLLHALAAARRPGRIVEFGTSMGLSTIYLAAALRAGDPPVITTELEPAKVAAARVNIDRAGLGERVEFREGDAFDTLADLNEPVSLVFLDGWKGMYFSMLRLLEPHLVDGALVVADDTTLLPALCRDYLDYVRSDSSPYASAEIAVGDGLEVSTMRRP